MAATLNRLKVYALPAAAAVGFAAYKGTSPAAESSPATPAAVPAANGKKKLDPKMDLIMNEQLARNEYPKDLMEQYKRAAKCSLMAKNMTPELFEEYKNHKTKTAGWTIARAINTGVMHPSFCRLPRWRPRKLPRFFKVLLPRD
jgi:hypothetical protein